MVRFYYADERSAEGKEVWSAIDGPAHAEFFSKLVHGETQGPVLATFVKGVGYKKFE